MKIENLLEQVGISKHNPTVEEVEAGEKRSRDLIDDYLEGRIDLETFKEELDKLPKLDLIQLVRERNFKG